MGRCLKLTESGFRFTRREGTIGQGRQRAIRQPRGDIAQQCLSQRRPRAR